MLTNGEHKLTLNGVEHWVRVAGAEHATTPVVLVHGGPGANAFLLERTVGPFMAEELTIVYYDQRGCGRSERTPGRYTMRDLVLDLEALRGALGAERIDLAGFSFGGQVAAEYAVAFPGRVRRLALGAPSIAGPLRCSGRLAAMDAVADEPFREKVRAHASTLEHLPGELSYPLVAGLWREMSGETAARFALHDPSFAGKIPSLGIESDPDFGTDVFREPRPGNLLDDLAALDLPALVVVGVYDRAIGVDACRDLADRLPGARLGILDRSAHSPIEQPELYAEHIRRFLA
ncbi:alpha/beta fold hydrolase [Longispora albida]|uniref:alpha/beta fold hydrolase n=1 Tax=Longispora albida TaxID=203523 RepID=UPI00037D126B|nr:alpha/beta hydrolase [Longispora albida]